MKTQLIIKKVAAKHGMTLKDIADKLGLNYSSYCTSIRNNTSIATLQKTADAIGVEVWELFKRDSFKAIILEGDDIKVFNTKKDLKEYI